MFISLSKLIFVLVQAVETKYFSLEAGLDQIQYLFTIHLLKSILIP